MLILGIVVIMFFVWAINAFITIEKASTKCEELITNRDPFIMSRGEIAVDEIFRWYSSWFGFRWWFQTFKVPTE